ncbi:protein SICKLE isoform X2 [Vicia villosa]|uniref:protein SICKLE isoform X2 n=1 Tax=Vicia villosa TaxID=3911 RepID=UPI00273B5B30|nr:protein SICKLE isoform X2 [Vicia villosa]
MEDSEQRRKRLKEMRLQADLAGDSGGGGGGGEGSGTQGVLSNPLAEAPSIMLPSDAAPRFNYYTDPMNAFSSDKRSSDNVRVQAPEYLPPPPPLPVNFRGSPMGQFSPHTESTNPQMSPSATQAMPAPYRNPVWNGPRGPPQQNYPFRPSGGGTYPSPRFEPPGGPSYNKAPGMNQWPGHNPNPRFEPPGGPSYNNAPGTNQWRNHNPNASSGFRPNYSEGYIPNPSSGYSPNHSPAFRNGPNTGRGRGRGFWQNTRGPVSGHGGRQGSGSHGRWSNEDRSYGPERYYKRSMIEDPWKCLKPVIWCSKYPFSNISFTPENSKPRAPSESTSTKREGQPADFSKPNSGPSLAEYLASAFNEAANTEE